MENYFWQGKQNDELDRTFIWKGQVIVIMTDN